MMNVEMSLGAGKPNSLNSIVKIGQGHLSLSEENLSFDK